VEVKVPALPDKVKEVVLVQWQVEEGHSVDEGDDVATIEAQGESWSITAPRAGVVSDIYFEEGDIVGPGEVIAEIEEED